MSYEQKRLYALNISIAMAVVMRRLDECSGGTQLHYMCRWAGTNHDYPEKWFNEIELVEHPDIKDTP